MLSLLRSHFKSTTALVVLVIGPGLALADENYSNVNQNGTGNSGLVTQGPGDRNAVGATGLPLLQDGNGNDFSVLQQGDDNEAGTGGAGIRQLSNRNSATIVQATSGNRIIEVTQQGIASANGGAALRRNTLSIDQGGGDGNLVSRVEQVRTSNVLTNGQAGNNADIVQSGADNIVGRASLNGGGVSQNGWGHDVAIDQIGAGNIVEEVIQRGNRQEAVVEQDGDGNVVAQIDQRGSRNVASLSFLGADNGTNSFDITSRANGAFGSLTNGFVRQDNDFFGAGLLDANLLGFVVLGDRNSFGFDQSGSNNDIDAFVDGDENQTGVRQFGAGNIGEIDIEGSRNHAYIDQGPGIVNLANSASILISEDDNHVGLVQSGTANDAMADVAGNGNTVNIFQESLILGNEALVGIVGDANSVALDQSGNNGAFVDIFGDDNDVDLAQTGNNEAEIGIDGSANIIVGTQTSGLFGSNELAIDIIGSSNDVLIDQVSGSASNSAFVNITGDNNFLDTRQNAGGGAGNTLSVDIFGNNNNRSGFSGVAATVAGSFAPALTPGQIIQVGSGNTVAMTVGGADPLSQSNDNRFAFFQSGSGNAIEGLTIGSENQVVVVQQGDANFASFTQIGNGNVIGILQ